MFDLLGWAKVGGERVGKAWGWFQNWRTRARVELSLTWGYPPFMVIGKRNETWRAIDLRIVTAKQEGFVVAAGEAEARKVGDRRWAKAAPLEGLLFLPVEIAANRAWSGQIDGKVLIPHLEQIGFRAADPLEIRIVLRDLHIGRITSKPLQVSIDELRREGTR